MPLQRVQMLLEPKQRCKLAELAKTQGKSIAEITRQAINLGLAQMVQNSQQVRMLAALEAAQALRQQMRQRNGQLLDIQVVEDIQQMRDERDEELSRRSGF